MLTSPSSRVDFKSEWSHSFAPPMCLHDVEGHKLSCTFIEICVNWEIQTGGKGLKRRKHVTIYCITILKFSAVSISFGDRNIAVWKNGREQLHNFA